MYVMINCNEDELRTLIDGLQEEHIEYTVKRIDFVDSAGPEYSYSTVELSFRYDGKLI